MISKPNELSVSAYKVLAKFNKKKPKNKDFARTLCSTQAISFLELVHDSYIVEQDDGYYITLKGLLARENHNKEEFYRIYPLVVSTLAIIISIYALVR